MKGQTASEKIGAFVESVRAEDVSPPVVHQVARAFVDTFACAVGGRNEDASRIVRDYVLSSGGGGQATLWATGERASPEEAALTNGTMSHVLDYDDALGHPSASLLPALVALGETLGATGRQIAAAYAVGFEVIARLPYPLVSHHYARGWHVASSIGVLRAAMACAHLLGLDAARTASALGIAIAHVSGVRKSFGTMSKPLQLGIAASAGIRCARLAAAGFSGPRDSLDGPMGFLEVYGKGEDIHPYLDALGNEPPRAVLSRMEVKQYPCCYGTHCAIQGTLDLIAERPIPASEVERVRVTVQPRGLLPVVHKRPMLALEGKFSIEYTVAAALLDGAIRLGSFTDAAVQRREAQALLRKVETAEDEGDLLPFRALVEVELRDGERRSILVDKLRGGPDLPLTDAELETKLRDCVDFAGLEMDVEAFLSTVWGWGPRPIQEILECVRRGRVSQCKGVTDLWLGEGKQGGG